MGRSPCCDKKGLKKGPWTPEEDQKLIDYIKKNGYGNWRTLPANAGLQRCGKSCRLRWTNYLRPDIKRGRFSCEEENTIIQLHNILGNKWSAIAARLPGRTDNEIKNYWNTHIRKKLLRMGIDPVTHSPRLDLLDISSILSSSLYNPSQMNVSGLLGVHQPLVNPEILRLASSLMLSNGQNQRQTESHNQANDRNEDHQSRFLSPYASSQAELCNPQTQIQHQPLFQINHHSHHLQNPVQELPSCNNIIQYPDDDHHHQAQMVDVPNALKSFGGGEQDYVPFQPGYDYYGSDHTVIDPSFRFASVLSTPSSSPTPLNSNSTNYISSCSTEDESYCSNLMRFEIPDFLDVNGLM